VAESAAAAGPSPRQGSPVVWMSDVERTFAGQNPVRAVRNATLAVWPGDYISVMGKSGSGKSTLLQIVGLLDTQTSGRFLLDGNDMSTLTARQRSAIRATKLGFVFQAFHLLASRTALANVAMSLMYSGVPRSERRDKAALALSQVDMEHRADAYPNTLSGGERQRVAIARALAVAPRLILADEPTGNLDSGTAAKILSLFRKINDARQTIIVATHDSDVANEANRRFHMHDGVLAETTGEPAEAAGR